MNECNLALSITVRFIVLHFTLLYCYFYPAKRKSTCSTTGMIYFLSEKVKYSGQSFSDTYLLDSGSWMVVGHYFCSVRSSVRLWAERPPHWGGMWPARRPAAVRCSTAGSRAHTSWFLPAQGPLVVCLGPALCVWGSSSDRLHIWGASKANTSNRLPNPKMGHDLQDTVNDGMEDGIEIDTHTHALCGG